MMEKAKILQFPQYPEYRILITLFKDVVNSSELVDGLISGNENYAYAFISASNILNLEHLQAAIYRAVHDSESGIRSTRNIHSEVIYSLAAAKNIMDSLKKFGIKKDTTTVFAIKIIKFGNKKDLDQFHEFLVNKIRGKELEVSDREIALHTDMASVKKIYKSSNLYAIIGSMTLKGN